jgi:uncharacterized membrane protein
MDSVRLGAITVHTLAMILVVGYYGILGRVILPALRRSLDGPTMATALVAVARRALPLIGLAVALFVVTGAYLLLSDEQYAGLGRFAASTWTTLMLVKHLVVVVMIVVAIGVDRLIGWVADPVDEEARERALGLLGLGVDTVTGLGALVVLLTVAAQLS